MRKIPAVNVKNTKNTNFLELVINRKMHYAQFIIVFDPKFYLFCKNIKDFGL